MTIRAPRRHLSLVLFVAPTVAYGSLCACIPGLPPAPNEDGASDASLPNDGASDELHESVASDASLDGSETSDGRIDAADPSSRDADLPLDALADVSPDAPEGGPPPTLACDGDAACSGKPVEVVAGNDFGCARYDHGDVWCWGWNQYGQTGHMPVNGDPVWIDPSGTLWTFHPPARVPGLSAIKQVVAGGHFACALRDDGAVLCWGRNTTVPLGHAPTTDPRCPEAAPANSPSVTQPCKPTPTAVVGLPQGIIEIAAGAEHACARSATQLYCWGSNTGGQLARTNAQVHNSYVPLPIPNLGADITSMSLGWHTCVTLSDRTTKCWGENISGQLGHPIPNDSSCTYGGPCSPTPTTIMTAEGTPFLGAVRVSCGRSHTCALKDDGSVWCWGNHKFGVIGDFVSEDLQLVPKQVSGLPAVVKSLVAGNWMQAAIDPAGAVWMWGLNGLGQLGRGVLAATSCSGAFPCSPVATQLNHALLGEVRSLALGNDQAYATTADGMIWGWGGIAYGSMARLPGAAGDRADCSHADYSLNLCNPTPSVIAGFP